jgi:hypothetical protein
VVSNRRRTAADRARSYTAHHPSTRGRSRPFGGRARGGARSHAVLKRLHAMPRWTIPLATIVLVFVGVYAGAVIGSLCLLALAAFLGWLAYLAWPQLKTRDRLLRSLVLGLLIGAAMARLFGVWGG